MVSIDTFGIWCKLEGKRMTLAFSIGGIIRFVNTVGASWAFATGSFVFGTILAGLVVGSVLLEEWEPPESP